ncbi:Long chain acyl-CoA synthetase 3 [Coccomyxa sp. Obi]|nr:Long chain acyl-CoA synthetase 3 [Coccomyxa sp. Obi]
MPEQVKQVGTFTVAIGHGKPKEGSKNALSPIYRNTAAKDGWPSVEGAATTLYEVFEQSVKRHGDCKCLGWRPIVDGKPGPYEYWTYKETRERAAVLASSVVASGTKPGGRVGIYAPNCPNWMLIIQACNRSSLYVVPLYDSLGETAVEYTVNHSETSIIFAEASKLTFLAKAAKNVKENVKTVVYWGDAPTVKDAAASIEKEGIKVYEWEDFNKLGKSKPSEAVPPKPEDPATIMYTSGTTGNPKGVVLTHKNVLSTVAALQTFVREVGLNLGSEDSTLSYLTLAHILGRALEEFALSVGASIGYWQGDVRKLTDDISALKPTLFVAVPRVLERIQSGIQAKLKAKPWIVRTIVGLAYRWKLSKLKAGVPLNRATPLLDKYLFNTFKKAFGGRVRFIVSGGAPLSTHVEEYLKVTLCTPVFQGYGLTETCAASFIALPQQDNSGTVGPPTACVELRFEGSEELGYDPLANPPRGEICLRGPIVFDGYYQDKKKTEEAFDEDGFFHTGDVGELTPGGALKVVDRIKNMFKLAQGEYIAAEHLENTYAGCDAVEQIWVYGNSYESTLVAVVVPDKKELMGWAKENGVSGDFDAVVKDPKAAEHVTKALAAMAKQARLKGFERIAAVHLTAEPFSTDNDLMTPSFKLKRNKLQKTFQKQIDDLYKKLKAASSR